MTILQSLVALYDRLDRRGDAPKPGFAPVRIAFVLEIDKDGTPLGLIDIRDHSGRKPLALKRLLPAVSRTSGIKPAFLWDKTAYVFGVIGVEDEARIVPGQGKRTLDEHEAFRREHLEALQAASDPGLRGLALFLQKWRPEQWTERGFNNEALDTNVAFRLKGDDRRIDERDAALALIDARHAPNEAEAICLVTGDIAPFATLQPQFKGVAGAQSSGAPLVSFNADAFDSYDRKSGANAPVSESAAFKYGAALDWLLDRNNARSFRLGETTVVFWADDREAGVGEEAATEAEKAFWAEFGTDRDAEPEPDADADAEDAAAIGAELQKVKALRGPPDLAKLQPNTRVHVLGLSPNAGRIAVRFWLVDTFGHLEENLRRHKRDMAIEPPDRNPNQKAYALLYETAVQRKAENIPPRLGGELARAILTGGRYPSTLLAAVVGRIRADKDINAARAALCRGFIKRNFGEEEFPVGLNPESADSAYNLGRLFAAYEFAERSVADRNATIRAKYIGAASATPRRVFPILMRGHEHNATALAKGEGNQRGAGVKVAKTVSQILERFGGDTAFPTALRLEEQSRFFVGYYHQMAALYTKATADKDDTEGDDQ